MTAPLLWIVDDDEEDLWLMQHVAHELGVPCQLSCFPDGTALLAHLATPIERPKLIALDYHLPLMDGLEITRQLRQQPDLEPVPILWMSADVDPNWEQLGHDLGVKWYWAKPVDYMAWGNFMQRLCRVWEE